MPMCADVCSAAANRSGYLDYRELRNALRIYGLDATATGAARVLSAYDRNPDGRMDIAEVCAEAITSPHALTPPHAHMSPELSSHLMPPMPSPQPMPSCCLCPCSHAAQYLHCVPMPMLSIATAARLRDENARGHSAAVEQGSERIARARVRVCVCVCVSAVRSLRV
jgi:hypothetical protein